MIALFSLSGKVFESVHGSIKGPLSGGLYDVLSPTTGKHGYSDLEHQVRIPFAYDQAYPFDTVNGCARIGRGELYGLINLQNDAIVPCVYQDVGYISDGRIRYREDEKYGYFDRFGRPAIRPQFAYAQDFRCGLAAVRYPTSVGS